MDGHIYVTNGENKQANLVDVQFSSNFALFFESWYGKLLEKEPQIWKYVIYVHWTIGWLDIQKFLKSNYVVFKKD